MSMIRALIALLLLLVLVALLVILQVWMCKKSLNLGLILPGIFLALGLLLTGILPSMRWAPCLRTCLCSVGSSWWANYPHDHLWPGSGCDFKSRRDTLDDLQRMQIKDLE